MNQRIDRPALSRGNHIYLYQLLKNTLGTGKQTFLPAVEDALAAEQFTAEDLGFAGTRELLEELDDFVDLKVFKGGRIYATIVAQPAWDEALASTDKVEKGGAKAGGKSWKRKKSDKSLRPVRPRRVKRQEPAEDIAEEETPAKTEEVVVPQEAHDNPAETAPEMQEASDAVESASETVIEMPAHTNASEETGAPDNPGAVSADFEQQAAEDAVGEPRGATAEPEKEDDAAPAPEPASTGNLSTSHISLTVVYDPSGETAAGDELIASEADKSSAPTQVVVTKANRQTAPEHQPASPEMAEAAGAETKSSDVGHKIPADIGSSKRSNEPTAPVVHDATPRASEQKSADDSAASSGSNRDVTEPLPAPASESAPAPVPANAPAETSKTPEPTRRSSAPAADYPVDFAREVYCPGDLLVALTHLLPYGADVLGILSAYFDIAKLAGTIEGGRTRATFPVGYIRDGERREVGVTIKKRVGKSAAQGQAWTVAAVEHDAE